MDCKVHETLAHQEWTKTWRKSAKHRIVIESTHGSIKKLLISYRSGTHTYADRKRSEEICSASFDGPGGVLAHAFYPSNVVNYTAEIHVDAAERWHIYLTEKSASNKDYLLNMLTHEIGHALGLTYSSREDSIMFAYVTASKPTTIQPPTSTTTPPPTTEITSDKSEYIDFCSLQYVDTILVLLHRIFVTYQHDTKYDGPYILNSYMDFLPENFSLSAAYQRPSGKLVLFVNNIVYMIEYPSFKLKEGWPKRLSSLGFPPNTFIDTVNDVAQIDECSMTVRSYQPLQAVFPGIPPAPTLAFRYINGNLPNNNNFTHLTSSREP
ncbi:MMP14 protein, partial [Acromyrmex insinuator]